MPVEDAGELPEQRLVLALLKGVNVLDEVLRGQDAVLTHQPVILHPPGNEGDQVDPRQQTRKQPADKAVASAMGFEPGERAHDWDSWIMVS